MGQTYPLTNLDGNFCRNPNGRDTIWCNVDEDAHGYTAAAGPCKRKSDNQMTVGTDMVADAAAATERDCQESCDADYECRAFYQTADGSGCYKWTGLEEF